MTRNYISKYRYPNNRDIHDMAELSLEGLFGIGEALGIIATLFVILYFSRKQMQSLSVDIQTKVLNDLDEKVRKMAEIIIEKPSLQKVIYKLEKPSEELAFAYYILLLSVFLGFVSVFLVFYYLKNRCSRVPSRPNSASGARDPFRQSCGSAVRCPFRFAQEG